MTTVHYIAGEDHDFQRIGLVGVDTATTAARRTANARCSLKVGPAPSVTDGWQSYPWLNGAQSSFWFIARMYSASGLGSTSEFLTFLDGTVRRLVFACDGANHIRLKKRTAAAVDTTLATASITWPSSALVKFDVHVVYGTSGSVDLYQDGVLLFSYSGDITTDSATTLSGFVLGGTTSVSANTYWSEIFMTDSDTRSQSLVTLPPAANGNAWAWSASYANVDETTLDDADIATSSSANDIAQTTINSSGITGNPAIIAVGVSARAQKGASGPANADLMVRTGGNDYVSSDIALSSSMSRVANAWTTNPASAGAWAYTDLTAAGFNIGIKSKT